MDKPDLELREEEFNPNDSGTESPRSVSITAYYKGYSVLVTKRTEAAKVKPLIDSAIEAIEYMIHLGFEPSWNKETNQSRRSAQSTSWVDQPTDLGNCSKCGEPNKLSKAGKVYCSAKCWLK